MLLVPIFKTFNYLQAYQKITDEKWINSFYQGPIDLCASPDSISSRPLPSESYGDDDMRTSNDTIESIDENKTDSRFVYFKGTPRFA